MPKIATSDFSVLIWNGNDTLRFLNSISSNDVLLVNEGQVVSTIVLDNKAKIVDFIHIFQLNGNIITISFKPHLERLYQYVSGKILGQDVAFSDISRLNTLTINYGESIVSKCNTCFSENGITNVNVNDKFEFLITPKNMTNEADSAEIDFTDWRIDNALPWYGFEITQTRNPYQCGLNEYVHEDKGCYTGQEILTRMRSRNKGMKQIYVGDNKDLDKSNITTQGSKNFLSIINS